MGLFKNFDCGRFRCRMSISECLRRRRSALNGVGCRGCVQGERHEADFGSELPNEKPRQTVDGELKETAVKRPKAVPTTQGSAASPAPVALPVAFRILRDEHGQVLYAPQADLALPITAEIRVLVDVIASGEIDVRTLKTVLDGRWS